MRVVIVEPMDVPREGLAVMVSKDPDFEVVGKLTGTEKDFTKQIRTFDPCVVLVGLDGSEEKIKQVCAIARGTGTSSRPVLVLGPSVNRNFYELFAAGVVGFLTWNEVSDAVLHAVLRTVDSGNLVLSKEIAAHSFLYRDGSDGVAKAIKPTLQEQLTAREKDVLGLLIRGFPNRVIAKELSLAEVTVKKHVQSIIAKFGVSDRTQVVIMAITTGILAPAAAKG